MVDQTHMVQANSWQRDIEFANNDDLTAVLQQIPEYFINCETHVEEQAGEEEKGEESDGAEDGNEAEEEEEEEEEEKREDREREKRQDMGKRVYKSDSERKQAISIEVQRAQLDLVRLTMSLQHDTATNFVLVRTREMINCVWNWIHQHYILQGTALAAPVYDFDTFKVVICSSYCELEELKPCISWYCNLFNDRYLFATVLFAVGTTLFEQSELRIAQSMLYSIHTSSADAASTVGPLRHDEYWNCFLKHLLKEMCSAVRDRTKAMKNAASQTAANYLEQKFASLIDEFYWNVLQQEAIGLDSKICTRRKTLYYTAVNHDAVFNESTKSLCKSFCGSNGKTTQSGSNDLIANK